MKKTPKFLFSLLFLFSLFFVTSCNIGWNDLNSSTTTSDQYEKDEQYVIYELALSEGKFNGTYEEWLNSIKGADGKPGENGKSAYELYKQLHPEYTGTLEEWFETLKGKDGNDGKSAYEIYKEAHPEYNKSEQEWLDDLVNGKLGNHINHIVTFDAQGGQPIEPQVVEHLNKVKKPKDPIKDGSVFDGWYIDGEKWVFNGYNVTDDITLQAKWILRDLNISIYITDNSNPITYTKHYGDEFDYVLNQEREGFKFIGWEDENQNPVELPFIVRKDIKLYAQWALDVYEGPEITVEDVDISHMNDSLLPQTKNVYNVLHYTDPRHLKPYSYSSIDESQFISNFFDGLVDFDNYGNLVPSLAKSIPSPTKDPVTGETKYIFELKDNLQWSKWQDGKLVSAAPITAEDFVTVAKLALKNDINNQGGINFNYLYFMFVKNCKEYFDYQSTPHNQMELDSYWSQNVGIKALDSKHIQYVLLEPMPSFPSVLTHSCFYPVPTQLYNQIGNQYGCINSFNTRDYIWYSGAFALDKFYDNNYIDCVKNDLYWDKENVSIQKIHSINSFNESINSSATGRELYEQGKIDSFIVNKSDKVGWSKYVTGSNNTNYIGNPINNIANATKGQGDGSTIFLSYNYNRTNRNYKTITDAQVDDFEKAIKNANFRKAILYGLNKGKHNMRYNQSNPNGCNLNTYTVSDFSIDDNGKDYTDYVIDEFASQNGISFVEAQNKLGYGKLGVYDTTLAKSYLQKAVQELGNTVTYPIQFEISEQEMYGLYSKEFEKSLQNAIDPEGKYIKFKTYLFNNNTFDDSYWSQDYSVTTYLGWYPDYNDPNSFLEPLTINGDLLPSLGLGNSPELTNNILGKYTQLVSNANSLTNKQERLKAFAKAEYYLLYDQALIIPLFERGGDVKVTVTKVMPNSTPLAKFGHSPYKLKNIVVYDQSLTKEQYAYLVNKHNLHK